MKYFQQFPIDYSREELPMSPDPTEVLVEIDIKEYLTSVNTQWIIP